MLERQLFLISTNKSRRSGQWSKDDYDVREGALNGPVIGRTTSCRSRRRATGGSGRSSYFRPWTLTAAPLKRAKLRWTHSRRSGWSGMGGSIRGSGGASTKYEKEAARPTAASKFLCNGQLEPVFDGG